jgi:hypothetical protein
LPFQTAINSKITNHDYRTNNKKILKLLDYIAFKGSSKKIDKSLHISSKMVLHMVFLTKPAVAGVLISVVCVLKLLMGFRFFKDGVLYQSRLFLFNSARMERAFRLIFPTHDVVTTSSQSDHELQNEQEEMFYSLSMLAL